MADMAWLREIRAGCAPGTKAKNDQASGTPGEALLSDRDRARGGFPIPAKSLDQIGNVQLFSSLVAAIISRSSLGPGTAGLEAKMSHWFLILSAGSAVTAYISCISW